MYFFVFRMSTAVCKCERFSSMHVLKSGIERLSITRQRKLLTKCRCGVVFWNKIEINFFLNGRIKLVCTQMTCQNQINVLTVCMISKVICIKIMRNMFFGQSDMYFFFGFFERIAASGNEIGVTKDERVVRIRSHTIWRWSWLMPHQNTTKWRLLSLHRNIFIVISDFSKSLRSFFSFGHLTGILSVLGITSTL